MSLEHFNLSRLLPPLPEHCTQAAEGENEPVIAVIRWRDVTSTEVEEVRICSR